MIHTVKGFGVVNKAKVDVFLEVSRFFDDPMDVGNLISGSSAFSKTSLNTWKFTVHVLLNIQGAEAVRAQEDREELLLVQGQEGQLWRDTPRPR